MVAQVVPICESNFRDPAATLRKIADGVERGDYGRVGTVGIAMLGDTLEVFGAGPDSDGSSVALVLHAGFMRLSKAIEEHGQ